ncbi:TPA: type I toxin-antitoxin system Ibs family toxin [Escherichia coli]|nr:type I toxin-antitoxin system Ibs family toxin [Escherichia coli]
MMKLVIILIVLLIVSFADY